MFRSIANMPIFRRLFLAFVLAAVIPGILISVLCVFYIGTLNAQGQAVQISNQALSLSYEQLGSLQRMNALLEALFTTNTPDPEMTRRAQSNTIEIRALQSKFNLGLTHYQQNYQITSADNMSGIRSILSGDASGSQISSDQQNTLNLVERQWPVYTQAQAKLLQVLPPGKPVSLTKTEPLLQNATAAYDPLEQNWQHLVNLTASMGDVIARAGASQSNSIILITVLSMLATVAIVIVIGYLVNLTITRPLRSLATLTRRIAKGETGVRAKIMGRDEIYMVATSMNNMLDNIVRLIQETQSQRDVLQAQVEKLVSEVSGVGEGDLRVQAEVTTDALGVLADSFNYMVEELGSLVVRVKMVAHEVENSTELILDRMMQLVESGDRQIQQIATAAVEVEHVTSSSRQVAERAQVLYTIARDTHQNAQDGRDAVQQAIAGMGRIHENVQATAGKVQLLGERSREIDEIIDAIGNIAHQTNRLALDAAIQAAMAGENGKGFGAVAADIRRLAERAKDQASLITRIVRSVREDIGAAAVSMQDTARETSTGAKLIQEAGTTLGSIFASIEHQAAEIETINLMAAQQLQSSSAIVQIMNTVSDATQQSGASTREASQSMERLARLAEQLRSSVEAFKLRESQNYYAPTPQLDMPYMEDEQDNQMTVSGIFRTVSATTQPQTSSAYSALPPSRATGVNPIPSRYQ